jgi:hypothetical protein
MSRANATLAVQPPIRVSNESPFGKTEVLGSCHCYRLPIWYHSPRSLSDLKKETV